MLESACTGWTFEATKEGHVSECRVEGVSRDQDFTMRPTTSDDQDARRNAPKRYWGLEQSLTGCFRLANGEVVGTECQICIRTSGTAWPSAKTGRAVQYEL